MVGLVYFIEAKLRNFPLHRMVIRRWGYQQLVGENTKQGESKGWIAW